MPRSLERPRSPYTGTPVGREWEENRMRLKGTGANSALLIVVIIAVVVVAAALVYFLVLTPR